MRAGDVDCIEAIGLSGTGRDNVTGRGSKGESGGSQITMPQHRALGCMQPAAHVYGRVVIVCLAAGHSSLW